MFLKEFYSKSNSGIQIAAEQASQFAKEIAGDFNPLHDPDTAVCVQSERALNFHLQGGCQVPIACFATLSHNRQEIFLRGLVGRVDGGLILRASAVGAVDKPEELGVVVADDLLSQGAGGILAEVYGDG